MAKLKSGTRIYGTATIDTSVVVGSAVTLSSSGIQVSGISTLGVTSATNLTSQQLNVSGISTFTNGPILVGTATSTGTASQPLQVTGGAYVSGNLGIGTTNPTSNLHVVGDVRVTGVVTATTFVGTLTGTATSTTNIPNLTGDITSVNNATTLATVNSNVGTFGGTGAGTTITVNAKGLITGITTFALAASGSSITVSDDTSTNATRYPIFEDVTSGTSSSINVSSTKLTFNPSTGTLSATVFTSLSDETQKTNIRPVENATYIVSQMNGVYYDWVDSHNAGSVGVIAQEIEKVLPEVVTTNDQGLKTVSYGNIVGVLIEAIKEQQVRIEELERKLNA